MQPRARRHSIARRLRTKETLRLRASSLSQNAIVRAANISKHSVREVLNAAKESLPDMERRGGHDGLRGLREAVPE